MLEEIGGAIEHHGKQILMCVLATFVALGSDGKGSYSLSQDQSSFFVKALDDMASYFAEQIDEQVLKKWVILNYGERDIYPKLKYAPLGDLELKDIADAVSTLVAAGMIDTDVNSKIWVRDLFKMPAIPPEKVEAMREREIEEELSSLESTGPKSPEEEAAAAQAAGKPPTAKPPFGKPVPAPAPIEK